MKLVYLFGCVLLLTLTSIFWSQPTLAAKFEGEPSIERVSLMTGGIEGPAGFDGDLSTDGRYTVFISAAPYVPEDVNGLWDAFVYDRQLQTTEIVSIASDGTQANDSIRQVRISGDGRYVAFSSRATNLVPNDTNNRDDIFLHDRQTNTTELISVASDGSQGNLPSLWNPAISGDGRFVVFISYASNLVLGDTNNRPDVFVRDRVLGQTTRVSVASDGTQSNQNSHHAYTPNISSDGRYVTFTSNATNLVSIPTSSFHTKVFVHDQLTGETTLESVTETGVAANNRSEFSDISDDGRFVVFQSNADNLVPNDTNEMADVFLKDRVSQAITLISRSYDGGLGNARSVQANISGDGRFIAFQSSANNLVLNDTNECEPFMESCGEIYLNDRLTGLTQRISLGYDGSESDGDVSFINGISTDGRYIGFHSDSSNLIPDDTNEQPDVFLYDQGAQILLTPTPSHTATQTPTPSNTPTATYTPTTTPTFTQTPTNSPSPTHTATVTPSHTPSATFTASATATETATPTSTATPSNTPSPSATATATETVTPTYTATPSHTPSPSPTASVTTTTTPTATLTQTPSATATATASATAIPTQTPTVTRTPSPSPTNTITSTATRTPVAPTYTPTITTTLTPTVTGTATISQRYLYLPMLYKGAND